MKRSKTKKERRGKRQKNCKISEKIDKERAEREGKRKERAGQNGVHAESLTTKGTNQPTSDSYSMHLRRTTARRSIRIFFRYIHLRLLLHWQSLVMFVLMLRVNICGRWFDGGTSTSTNCRWFGSSGDRLNMILIHIVRHGTYHHRLRLLRHQHHPWGGVAVCVTPGRLPRRPNDLTRSIMVSLYPVNVCRYYLFDVPSIEIDFS